MENYISKHICKKNCGRCSSRVSGIKQMTFRSCWRCDRKRLVESVIFHVIEAKEYSAVRTSIGRLPRPLEEGR